MPALPSLAVRSTVVLCLLAGAAAPAVAQRGAPGAYTMEQVKSYPFPNELTAAATGSRVAWAFNERGLRNLWVAEGPNFRPRQLTRYDRDDGQELSRVQLSADGRWVVYMRGGDQANWDDYVPVNPTSSPTGQAVGVWSVAYEGGEPKLLADGGAEPAVSPRGDRVAFIKDRLVWVAPIDGSAPAKRLFTARGEMADLRWSPDGGRLAFVSGRGTHALIGIYTDSATPIRWMAPSTSRDGSPRWSPDGRRIAFVRRPGAGGAPDSILARRHVPWGIWTADATTGQASRLWQAPTTLAGSAPSTHGGTNLHWTRAGRIAFLSYHDGWPHLYSIPENGGEPLLLTPGDWMAEHVTLAADGRSLLFSANAGREAGDIDRRHVVRAPVDRAAPEVLTPGTGLEWTPVSTGDGRSIVFLSATAQRPPLPAVMPAAGGPARLLAEDRIPADFPTTALVTPKQVVYTASDGVRVHAQLFESAGGPARKPAVVFVHGGPPRQMLLGWHYSDYYSNTYAMNQYLASQGYVVLSINYRLGIGYGYDFHRPPGAGAQGASEYLDVKAAGEYLRSLPQVDAAKIGIYGGSYGGYLTALALARDSDLFSAGVDIHGVHDWTTERARGMMNRERYEQAPDLEAALETAWRSSVLPDLGGWRSPVLLIHGDDDRNVRFGQTVDLARRLEAAGVPFEELVIPDDTHHWMRWANAVLVNQATVDFFNRVYGMGGRATEARR